MPRLLYLTFSLLIYTGFDTSAAEYKNQHYSLYPSLDRHKKLTAAPVFIKSTSVVPIVTSVIPSIKVSVNSDWLRQTSLSRMPPKPYVPFIRYERSELAYRPYFDDILYFSCEAWIPDHLEEVPEVLLAEQARSILTEYFVVPYSEWRNSYPKSGKFAHYARLKFPDDINLRLLVHELGVAIVLYPDGGAVFLAQDLHQYQIELAKKYKFRLRTDEI